MPPGGQRLQLQPCNLPGGWRIQTSTAQETRTMNTDTVAVFIPITAIVMSLADPHRLRDHRLSPPPRHRRGAPQGAPGRDRAWHGDSPLPEAFFKPLGRVERPRHLLTGMIWLFVGIAVFLFLGAVADSSVAYLGLIPGRRRRCVPDLLLRRRTQGTGRIQGAGSCRECRDEHGRGAEEVLTGRDGQPAARRAAPRRLSDPDDWLRPPVHCEDGGQSTNREVPCQG